MKKIGIVRQYDNKEITKLDKILKYLFIISIILIPFDNLPYLGNLLGEMSVKGSVYVFIFIIPLTFIKLIINREVFIPKGKIKNKIIIFCSWTLLSILVNIPSILNNSFKGRIGIEKLILQVFVVIFMLLVSYCSIYIVERNNIRLENIRKYIMWSLIPVVLLGLLELIHIFSIIDFASTIEKISYFIHLYNRGVVYPKGIRSVTGEASYFAMYFAFSFPFIISYLFTEKKGKSRILFGLLATIFFILVLFTKSRTAYAIIFIEIFMLFFFIISTKVDIYKKKILIIIALVIGTIVLLFNNIDKINKHGGDENSAQNLSVSGLQQSLSDNKNMSNVARLGMMKASFNIGTDNPLFGVGIGQYGFYASQYLDEEALTSSEVQRWVDPKSEKEFWPPAFSLYTRIIAEQGFIGIVIWGCILIYSIYKLIKRVYSTNNDFVGVALLMSYIGVIICCLNSDTFAYVNLWIIFSIIDKYTDRKNIMLD